MDVPLLNKDSFQKPVFRWFEHFSVFRADSKPRALSQTRTAIVTWYGLATRHRFVSHAASVYKVGIRERYLAG